MTIKQKIYSTFLNNLNEKILSFQHTLDDLRASVLNETKSTAGDKHETALSMLQLEQSQIAKHMYDAMDARTLFTQINTDAQSEFVKIGSLVQTNKGLFFIGVALPKITINQIEILAISAKSPLGMQLLGKKQGDQLKINTTSYIIEMVS
jgi:hypothetical protein